MTEYALAQELEATGEQEAGRRRERSRGARVLRVLAVLLLVGWSALWLPPLFAEVGAQTALGRNGLRGVPSGYEVFELLFVAGHMGLRWLPGAAVSAALFWLSGRSRRKARAR